MARIRLTATRVATLVDVLQRKPVTYAQMATISGCAENAVASWVRRMRNDPNALNVYVEGYAPDAVGREFIPKWRIGKGEDAPRPGRKRGPGAHL